MRVQTPTTAPAQDELRLHMGGLAEGTPILTAKGMVKIEDIVAGDRIVTRDKGMQPVSLITQRALPRGDVLRVSPAALGRSADGPDIIVAPTQRLILRDWRAKAMFDRPVALVSARKLIDGEYVRRVPALNLRLFSLHFDALRIVYSGDIELGTATPVTQIFAL